MALTKKYILQKKGVRESTRAGYKTVTNILEKEEFGAKRIDKVKLSDAKEWLIKLQDQDGRSYSSIHTIRGVLRPAFQMAVDDDLLRKNPFQFEFVGLTIKDIDLKEKTIHIDHQLQRTSQMQYIIEPPKTEAGNRVIPMQEKVCECFRRIIQNRRKPKVEPMVGGKVGFLYLGKNEMPMVALHWEKYFQHIVEKYNKIYKVQMPKITPHVCRHTYCSHCASSGMNPKHSQYLMGHSDISVTLNTYTHVDFDNVKKKVQSLEKAAL